MWFLKMRLIEILNDMLGPMQERRAMYENYDLMKLVSAGTLAASDIAEEVLSRMKSAMYLW